MKKLYIIYVLLFSIQSFASGIDAAATSATCDNSTLETYGGTANVEIDWAPNKIDLYWYDGNTKITGPTSCNYDDVLNVPSTPPTKTGYTFAGWQASPHYDFSTLPTDVGGIEYRGVNANGRYCWHWTSNSEVDSDHTCTSDFAHLNPFEWEVIFPWGTVYGTSLCSTTAESIVGTVGTPDESGGGKYTWCKITGYKPTNSDTKYSPNNPVSWVFASDSEVRIPARECTWHSTIDCSRLTNTGISFRSALFGK